MCFFSGKYLNMPGAFSVTQQQGTRSPFLAADRVCSTWCSVLFYISISCPFFFSSLCLFPVTRLLNYKGHIPSTLGRLVNLRQLDLAYNHLSGTIPSEVRGWPSRGLGAFFFRFFARLFSKRDT